MNTKEMQLQNMTICEKHNCEKIEKVYFGKSIYFCEECSKEYEIEKNEKEKFEKEERERYMKLRGIPKKFENADLSHFENIDPVLKWVEHPKGFLFVHGNCGCGKTHLSAAIKKKFNIENKLCFLEFSSNLFLKLRNTFNKTNNETESGFINQYAPDEGYIKSRTQAGGKVDVEICGIFDDIGAQKISEYVIEAWYNIIDRRYMFDYPTMFTSNLSLKEISFCMTDRIASRIASGVIFELKGNDRRLVK